MGGLVLEFTCTALALVGWRCRMEQDALPKWDQHSSDKSLFGDRDHFWGWRMMRPAWLIHPEVKYHGRTMFPEFLMENQQIIVLTTDPKLLSWHSLGASDWQSNTSHYKNPVPMFRGGIFISFLACVWRIFPGVGMPLKVTPQGWAEEICPQSLGWVSDINLYWEIILPDLISLLQLIVHYRSKQSYLYCAANNSD